MPIGWVIALLLWVGIGTTTTVLAYSDDQIKRVKNGLSADDLSIIQYFLMMGIGMLMGPVAVFMSYMENRNSR